MEKPELTISDLVTSLFALLEKEDKIKALFGTVGTPELDMFLRKSLDEIQALQVKIKQILSATPARTPE